MVLNIRVIVCDAEMCQGMGLASLVPYISVVQIFSIFDVQIPCSPYTIASTTKIK